MGLAPAEVLAQCNPPFYTADRQANLAGILAVTTGLLAGLTSVVVFSMDMLSTETLAVLGASGLAIIGGSAGILAGYRFFAYMYQCGGSYRPPCLAVENKL